ncbi:hypothetical protein [Maribacter polysaccharolyticus]|uniref:hypothetical protein n=1 Tax=Maribacter polysaccharolyticus TaxID=3020831 RepID=UPI00237FBDE8|nr:hypothetical protein [Maribacter polysaccharolyticus]MDE3742016.1 hypothetical protein [Maribacter polysaccharolyticus]
MEHGRWNERIGLSGISMIFLLLLHLPMGCSEDEKENSDKLQIAIGRDGISDQAAVVFEAAKDRRSPVNDDTGNE